jgi:hypothetical protein
MEMLNCNYVNESLPGPQTPEKIKKQASFVSLDVEKSSRKI